MTFGSERPVLQWTAGTEVDVDAEDGLECATILGPASTGDASQRRVRFADGVEDDWDVQDFQVRAWPANTLVEIDTEDGLETGAMVLGPGAKPTERKVRFADGSVDDWPVEDLRKPQGASASSKDQQGGGVGADSHTEAAKAPQTSAEEAGASSGSQEAAQSGSTSTFAVTFTEPGSLGLSFGSTSNTGLPWIKTIKPGTQAASHPELTLHQYLHAVDDLPVSSFKTAISAIKAAGRPVTLHFSLTAQPPAEEPPAEESPAEESPAEEPSAEVPPVEKTYGETTASYGEPLQADETEPITTATTNTAITIQVIGARGLQNSDPFARAVCGQEQRETEVVKRSSSPSWRAEPFQFESVADSAAYATVEVWDWDRVSKNDALGQVKVFVDEMRGEVVWLPLQPMAGCKSPQGEICLMCSVNVSTEQTTRPHAEDETAAEPESQPKPDWLSRGMNRVEQLTGLDIDGDGDIGVVGSVRASPADAKIVAQPEPEDTEATVLEVATSVDLLDQDAESDTQSEPSWLARGINSIEQASGLDIDGDGDVGVLGVHDVPEATDPEPLYDEHSRLLEHSATFAQAGAIGVSFKCPSGPAGIPWIANVMAGTQADAHPALAPQQYLRSVNGQVISTFKEALQAIDAAGRPVTLTFNTFPDLQVSFQDSGTLGLKFVKGQGGSVEIGVVNPGTQASRIAGLHAGLVLKAVGTRDVSQQMPYKDIVSLIKSHTTRPLVLRFGGLSKESSPVLTSAPSESAPLALSLPKSPTADLPLDSPASTMPPTSPRTIKVSFTKPGPLGIKFKDTQSTICIQSIHDSSQAASEVRPDSVLYLFVQPSACAGSPRSGAQLAAVCAQPELQAGLVLKSVQGDPIFGQPFKAVMGWVGT
jgi:hypothetical protein